MIPNIFLPILATISKMDGQSVTVSNYAGGAAVGSSWTDKVMAVKQQQAEKDISDNQGADDDEWVIKANGYHFIVGIKNRRPLINYHWAEAGVWCDKLRDPHKPSLGWGGGS